MLFFLFLILLFIIYFLSKQTVNLVFNILYKLIRHQKFSIYLLAFLFLPGTTLHEVSHFLMATLLHVKTGNLSVWPEIEPNGHIRAGHLMVAKTDPVRLTIIGVAPMIIGLVAIYFVGEYFFPQISRIFTAPVSSLTFNLSTIVGFYLIFQITGTFFSSKRDLQAAIYTTPILVLIVLAIYASQLQVTFEKNVYSRMLEILTRIDVSLALGVLIQLLLIIILTGVNSVLKSKK